MKTALPALLSFVALCGVVSCTPEPAASTLTATPSAAVAPASSAPASSGSASVAPQASASAAASATRPPADAPTSGPTHIEVRKLADKQADHGFQFVPVGFPAINADGSEVVSASVATDGMRGNPNLTIVFDTVSGTRRSTVILDADEYEKALKSKADIQKTIATRVAEANKLLATGWTPLRETKIAWKKEFETQPVKATVDGYDVTYAAPKLTLKKGSQVLLDRAFPDWVMKPSKPGTPLCTYASFPSRFAVDSAEKVLVVVVSQMEIHGGDVCNAEARIVVVKLK